MYTVHFNLYTLYTILTFKVSGSYYTDIEADCQLFHVCVQVSEYEVLVFHILGGLIFLCRVVFVLQRPKLRSRLKVLASTKAELNFSLEPWTKSRLSLVEDKI